MENQIIFVLNKEQLAKIEAECRASTVVSQTTTELQAGYQLGIQHVLNILRKGWTA